MPPSSSDRLMAMGVVTDLGSMLIVTASSRPNALQSRKALSMLTMLPTRHPTMMGTKWRLSTAICRYTE